MKGVTASIRLSADDDSTVIMGVIRVTALSDSDSLNSTPGQAIQQRVKDFHYVYLLISDCGEHRYTWLTQDLNQRLKKHNAGEVSHTSKHRPWRIQTAIAFESRERAAGYERYLKSHSGREYAKRHF